MEVVGHDPVPALAVDQGAEVVDVGAAGHVDQPVDAAEGVERSLDNGRGGTGGGEVGLDFDHRAGERIQLVQLVWGLVHGHDFGPGCQRGLARASADSPASGAGHDHRGPSEVS